MNEISLEAWKSFTREPCEERFRPIYEGTKGLVWTVCLRILRDHAEASDAFQGAYCRLLALARDPAQSAEVSDPGAIVCRLAIREADRLRKRRARRGAREKPLEELFMQDDQVPVEEAAMARETRERVEAIVEGLPERYRLPVQLHFFHGLSQREVARTLGRPLSSVSGRIQTALRRLNAAFRKAGLGRAAGTLAGIAALGALFDPPLSAAVVFGRAEAAAASLGAAAGATSFVSTTLILGSFIAMKKFIFASVLAVLALLAGILVHQEIRTPEPERDGAPAVIVADPAGRARPAEPAPQASTAPSRPERAPAVAVTAAEPAMDAVTGAVTDSRTNEPIPGATVRIGRRSVVTDDAGAYSIGGDLTADLRGETLELVASAEGYIDRPALVARGRGESVQDFPLDPAVSVLVTVFDGDGQPVSAASVTPSVFGSDGIFHGNETVETDASGKAELPRVNKLLPPSIQVTKEGYKTEYVRPSIEPAGGDAAVKVVIERIQTHDRAIAGRVTDPHGRGIPGATIEWKDGKGTRFGAGEVYGKIRATTDRAGVYRLDFSDESDRCSLGVAAKGWSPIVMAGVRPGAPDRPAEVNFTLEPAHWLEGRVVDGAGGPLSGVRIEAMPRLGLLNEGIAYPAVLRKTESDGEGRFRLDDLAGPAVAIQLRRARGDDRPDRQLEVSVDQEIDLAFKGWGVIRGRVVDGGSGEAVAGFTVRLQGSSTERWKPGESFTAADGRFSLKRLEQDGTFDFFVEAAGYLPAALDDVVAQDEKEGEEHVIELVRGRPLEGVVVDAATGAPMEGVQVGFTSREDGKDLLSMDWDSFRDYLAFKFERAVTGTDGSFRFLEGAPGSLLLRAAGRRRLFVPPENRSAYAGRGGKLRIPLERGESLSGILREAGKPLAGVDVHLARLKEPDGVPERPAVEVPGPARTGADGTFRWSELAPGSYVVEVEKKLSEPRPDFAVKVRRRVQVRAREESGEEARVDLGEGLGSMTLRGRLGGMEGRESVWANLLLRPVDGLDGPEFLLKTYKDWDWRFACSFLRPGKYAAEVEFYTRNGNLTVQIPSFEVTGDLERELEVPDGTN